MMSVRALLVPALIALAWLVWGAGSAQASTDPSKAAISESALGPSLVNAPSSPAAQLLPAGQDPASSTVQHVATAADAVVGSTAPAVSTVTAATEPVVLPVTRIAAPAVSAVSQTATSVTATVNRTVAPLVSALVDDAVASMTQPLPRLPLPAVNPPELTDPDIPVATVRETPPAAVSTALPSPVADVGQPGPDHPSGKVHAVQNIDSPFKTLARLKITASTRPLASAIQAPVRGLPHEHPLTEWLNNAVTHGEAGSSGSNSSASPTADIAASWKGLSPAAGALAAGAAVTPPSGPAADPGSSPD
ncbi:hypothetical protein [Arthrobacter sp. SLBN-112]|uniref:hypothetical protein n=1 Tax=Arthrobacter sp. SLBN-112 TaxID=2768452 RepID=UPI00114FE635|nr:hypothetical protein [Arthrobacter sp. SLBN-112]